jgi:hypothetical protein
MAGKENYPNAPYELDFSPKLVGIWICGCILIFGFSTIFIWKKKK